ncbi:CpsD/CapB family tyrosine-protein kinase [Geodermatophilus normandii]|uniref:CpsD/CapB family tyrosine-protein kinase n=1 Tax=Geodermatophilus normandii TaxID=1137989 RepID=A0A6P0GF79_9ACTN|nr:CpsD/CapB family tyrosine-protein kinase [Geodermatophilus normandii]NEM05909.1 CpsD/CapB family tyrosine-protein kinase [Geodermatophilus normandii]
MTAVLVAGAAGYLLSGMQATTYTAASRIVLSATQDFQPLGREAFGEATRFIAKQVSIVSTRPVLEGASSELRGSITPDDLARVVKVEASGDDDVITISASAPTAAEAADRANAIVTAYRDFVRRQVQVQATAAAAATADPAVADRIRTEAAAYDDGVAVVEEAVPPSDPASPARLRDAFILAVIAGLATVAVAVWRRPLSVDGPAWAGADRPLVLGTVPVRSGRAGRPVAVDPADHALVLVALGYARQSSPGPVLVTGTDWRGGPSVAIGLAMSARAQGRRVLLVDAAPESRALVTRATRGQQPHIGLDALGRPGVPATDVLLPVPGGPGVFLAVLGTDDNGAVDDVEIHRALDRAAEAVDLVLIQVGPLSASPIALALLRHAGIVIGVVSTSDAPSALTSLRNHVEMARVSLTGVVLTRQARWGLPQRSRPRHVLSRGTARDTAPPPSTANGHGSHPGNEAAPAGNGVPPAGVVTVPTSPPAVPRR